MGIPNPCAFCCCVPRTGAKIVAILNMVFQLFVIISIGFFLIIAKSGGSDAGDGLKLAMISFIGITVDLVANAILLRAVINKNIRGCKIWIYIEFLLAAIGTLQLIFQGLNSSPAQLEALQYHRKVFGTVVGFVFFFYEVWIVLAYIDQLQREQLEPAPEERPAQFAYGGSNGFVYSKPNPLPPVSGGQRYGFTTVPSLPGAAIYETLPDRFAADNVNENGNRANNNSEMICGPPPPYELVVGNGTGTGVPSV